MQAFLADVQFAARRLRATPLLTFGAVVTLALGIGSTVVSVDVLDRLLLRPPPHVSDPDRVARVYTGTPGSYMEITGYSTYEALEPLQEEFEAIAVYFNESLSLGRGREAQQLQSVAYGPAYFDLLGVIPAIGSLPDARSASDDAAVISYGLWQREFGGSPDALGRPLRLGTDTFVIAAVAPRWFSGIGFKPVDVWLPVSRRASATYGPEWRRQAFFLSLVARLRPGVTREQAGARATAAYRATRTQQWDKNVVVTLGDVRPARAPGVRIGSRVEVLVAGMAILVLLITCGNVASILLVRGLRRDREFAVKTALGATRARLLREVLLEASLLAAGAGAIALFVVTTSGTVIRSVFLAPTAARADPIDVRLVLITVVFCVIATFLLGLIPAIRLTVRRTLAPARSTSSKPSYALDVFSGLQVALSLPLIVAAIVFVLSLWNAQHQDFGMDTSKVAVVTTNLFEIGRPFETHATQRQIQARLARLPQVDATAMVVNLPMQGATQFLIRVPGREEPKGPVAMTTNMPVFNYVDPSFFHVMGMRVLDGRVFTDEENREGAAPVAVITASMAGSVWPGERAVGKCFYPGGDECVEVVGVLADARLFPSIKPTSDWASACYLPIERGAGASLRALLVRTTGDPARVLQTLRREAQAAAADLPYVTVHAFDDIFVSMLKPWRLGSIVFVVFGALSAVIAGVGLAVVAAYGVTRRTREIGIRSALGARPQQLVRLVIGRNIVAIMCGLAAGLGIAWASGRMLAAHVFGVTSNDPRVLACAALGLLVIGMLAAWAPARRAARIDPVHALRVE
jgi:putative ABC transport system permease protein